MQFLLARIEEDTAASLALVERYALDDRWVTDCRTRRRIVEFVAPEPDGVLGLDGCEVLLLLAAPYRGHDDFDPAWVAVT